MVDQWKTQVHQFRPLSSRNILNSLCSNRPGLLLHSSSLRRSLPAPTMMNQVRRNLLTMSRMKMIPNQIQCLRK